MGNTTPNEERNLRVKPLKAQQGSGSPPPTLLKGVLGDSVGTDNEQP